MNNSESFNTKFYPVYRSLVSMMAWLPVFFLYFNDHLEIKDVILLESIYYISVVILEVPSGMFSDYAGRKITLILSSLSFLVSYSIFGFISPDFNSLIVAQLFLAGGISFMSGTNTSFYFESLQEQGLESEYPQREARVQSLLQYTGAFAVLLGGFAGAIDLKITYIASFIFMVPAFILCLLFTEPKEEITIQHKSGESQFIKVLSYFKVPELRWIFVFSVGVYILAHIPYEFYQPYLNLLELEQFAMNTAIVSGILFAITRVFGAYAAGKSIKWTNKYGLKQVCAASVFIQLSIIVLLSLALHPGFIILLMLRSFSMSLTVAPLNAEIAPRVRKDHRASYFSLQSLASRLAFSICLVLLSLPVANEVINDWPTLSMIFRYAGIGGLIVILPLLYVNSGSLFQRKITNS
ncbi:MAG: MFS transporter [Bacteroidia bacterium]|nr:MFS transporter [Bacteroidia bacterium]